MSVKEQLFEFLGAKLLYDWFCHSLSYSIINDFLLSCGSGSVSSDPFGGKTDPDPDPT